MAKKRILWLINHTTLRQFEVPILEELGYEIYLPKIFPFDEANMSASIDYSYDEKLTISKEEINILNQVDFYTYIPENAKRIINENFNIAIFPFFISQFREVVNKYNGILVFHPFGFAENTYSNVIAYFAGYHLLERVEKVKNRFWFGQGYDNLAEVEGTVFKERAIHLPLGLKDSYLNDKWKGTNNNIFFVCPRINSNEYFNGIYKKFIEDFKEFDYIIGGAQPIEVNDKNVIGFVNREAYDEMFLNSKVMFYHSRYKRHIHYHPIEAVKVGMPLIFMSDGMLDELAGTRLPGSCKTIKEAKNKIKRIMNGDRSFIEELRRTQVVLLEKFSYEHCINIWRENLKIIEKESIVEAQQKVKKIAVILPKPNKDISYEYAKSLVKAIKKGIDDEKSDIELVFGHLKSYLFKANEFDDLENMDIKVREFFWEEITNERLTRIQKLKGNDVINGESSYLLPNDRINYFLDCDLWIFASDKVDKPIAPIRPYIVRVNDYMQRYLPTVYGDYYEDSLIKLVRKAEGILVDTPQVYDDCINYAGVRKEKIKMIPIIFENGEDCIRMGKSNRFEELYHKRYFVWTTNLLQNQNHLNTLSALTNYYDKGGDMICYVIGDKADLFDINKNKKINERDINPSLISVREFLEKNKHILKKVKFIGELSKMEYRKVLSGAKLHLHNVFTDNGSLDALEAVLLGVPSLSSDYPAMRYFDKVFNMKCQFFNAYNDCQLTDLLISGEQNYNEWKERLPNKSEIVVHSIENTYPEIWSIIKEIAMI